MNYTDVTIARVEKLDYRYNCDEISYEKYLELRKIIIDEN